MFTLKFSHATSRMMIFNPGEGGGGLPILAYTGRGTFFRLQVYKKVGISQVEVYNRVGKSVISQREVNK